MNGHKPTATSIPSPHDVGLWRFLLGQLKPRGPLLTPFNIISVQVIILGLVMIYIRFWKGLGAVTNLDQSFPWGIWIGFDVVTGVAFAGGAYVITFMVYVLGMDIYKPLVRATVLNGFLAYLFYAGALLLDLGRPWNVINPIIGNSFGVSSVLFLVAWHFMLYMIAELVEFSPAIAEWLGMERLRKVLKGLTIGAVVFGITLSTLHQSGLGALFLMASEKIHPLWYSQFIPLLFFVSSIFAGLSMVIFEGSISTKVFSYQLSDDDHHTHDRLLISLAKVCAGTLFAYLFLKILVFVHDQGWNHMGGAMGTWFLVEILGFVLLPMLLYLAAVRRESLIMVRIASIVTMLGIIINRLNISVIAFKWDSANHYFPHWVEIIVTLTIVFIEIWVFRWVIHRMPVLHALPDWARSSNRGGTEK